MFGIVDSGQKINANSLVLYLDAAQLRSYPGSGTTWTDLSGNSRNATLYNSPTFNSANGGGFDFDGTNDYGIIGGSALNGTGNFTVSAWARMPSDNANGIILCYDSSGCNGWSLRSSSVGSQDSTCTGFSARMYYFPDASNFINTTGTYWYNFTGVINYTTGKCTAYRNGVQAEESNTVGNGATGTSALWIGARDVPDTYTTLRISQVQRWNRALTTTEVQAHFNATKIRYGTLANP